MTDGVKWFGEALGGVWAARDVLLGPLADGQANIDDEGGS
jgi:hypothetical protein